jgi:hypothetical protein
VAVGEDPLLVKSLVDKVAAGKDLLRVLLNSLGSIIPPLLQIHLHLDTTLIRRTSGEALFRISGNIGRKSAFNCLLQTVPSGVLYFNQSQFLSCNMHLAKYTFNTKILNKISLEMFLAHLQRYISQRAFRFAKSREAENIFMKINKYL